MSAYPAYQMDVSDEGLDYDFITYCADCALLNSTLPFVLATGKRPESMEDVIAAMVLMPIERGDEPEYVPYGLVSPTGICDECDKVFEGAEESA